ncbi:hypothetical protein BDF20DRAFT_496775 [Mycotypha africana]|uniref:uncharacterized protein n=1 Tax=Mycotypha africana TaxID=64632 RepID=UPI002300ABE2|nr:uncharacterized protein BDF20DRAFT_496775 [Mycotypha africana]KAI8979319.1 hypothetical protein BDF20DRAFT_496775 [Mycotypha africana]
MRQQGLLHLPYELLVEIFAYLTFQDLLSVLSCHPTLYSLFYRKDSSFWFDICRVNHIGYRHPHFTWKDIVRSGEMQKMCPHLNAIVSRLQAGTKDLKKKQQFLWTTMSKYLQQQPPPLPPPSSRLEDELCLCLYPSCYHSEQWDINNNNNNNNKHTDVAQRHSHPVLLRLSSSHPLDFWCTLCLKTIGFHGFSTTIKEGLTSERYFMTRLLQAFMQPTSLLLPGEGVSGSMVHSRRMIELALYQRQFRQATTHIVDRQWFLAWIQFISGKSNKVPGVLSNEKLFRADGSLDPTLSLGKDFELINSTTLWYIQRVYGVSDKTICYTDLPNNADYCKLLHGIQIDQMNVASRYPDIHPIHDR